MYFLERVKPKTVFINSFSNGKKIMSMWHAFKKFYVNPYDSCKPLQFLNYQKNMITYKLSLIKIDKTYLKWCRSVSKLKNGNIENQNSQDHMN